MEALNACNFYHAHAGACITELVINGGFMPEIVHRVEFTTAMGKVYVVDDVEAGPEGQLVVPIVDGLAKNWNEYSGGLQAQVFEDGETCPADILLASCDEYGATDPAVYKLIHIDILGGNYSQNEIG